MGISILDNDDPDFDKAQWIDGKHAAYEERIIKLLLKSFGIDSSVFKRVCSEFTEKANFTWECFELLYPTFPVRMLVRSTPFIHQISVVDLFIRFSKTPIFREFEKGLKAYEWDLSDDKPTAMVFNWPAIGTMAFHTYHNAVDATSVTRVITVKGVQYTFALETFATLIETIKEEWEND